MTHLAPLEGVAADPGFELSPQQRRLARYGPAGAAGPYRVRCEVQITGPLAVPSLRAALGAVVQRHEVLRTRFRQVTGRVPAQVVYDQPEWAHAERDLRQLPPAAQSAQVEAAWQELASRPFDLAGGPPLSTWLLRLAEQEWLLLVGAAAMTTDPAGMDVLLTELAAAYQRERDGGPPPALPPQYPDLAGGLVDLLEAEDTAAGRGYWAARPAPRPGPVPLPQRPAPGRFAPRSVPVPGPAAGGVQELAHGLAVAPAAGWLALWLGYLSRLTHQPTLAVSVDGDGRGYEELATTVGPCQRQLPLTGQVECRDPVAALVGQLAATLTTADHWQDYLDPATEVPELSFAYRRPAPPRTAAAVVFAMRRLAACHAPHSLRLVVTSWEDRCQARLHYDRARYRRVDVQRLAAGFAALVAAVDGSGSQLLGSLPINAGPEQTRLLRAAAAGRAAWPGEQLLHRLVERRAARVPDRVAVTATDGTLTFRALDRAADQLAGWLRHAGVTGEARVGVVAGRQLGTVVGLLAVLKAGGCAVPLDPTLPAARREQLLRQAGVEVLVASDELPEPPAGVRLLRPPAAAAPGPPAAPTRVESPDQACYVLFTSGSAGLPKAVLLTHRGLVNRLRAGQAHYQLAPDDRVLHAAGFGFDFSIWELFAPLAAGATVVLAVPAEQAEAARAVALIRGQAVTTAHFVPSMLATVVDVPELAACHRLRLVFAGGEPLPPGLAQRLLDTLPVTLFNQYGPTEASVDVTVWRCGRAELADGVRIGAPLANTKAYVLDGGLWPTPVGGVGELYLGGDCLARGYLPEPHRTAERFVADPYGPPGARLYRTGDLCRVLPDGLEFRGREDHQVKIRGFRVELGEIEAALCAYPGVAEAVVLARQDRPGPRTLVAYLRSAGPPVAAPALREFLRGLLPAYQLPSHYLVLAELPRGSGGKVDRSALPAPGPGRPELAERYEPPRTDTERAVAELWCELLGLDRVGVHDNFLELGGHSLLATQLVIRLQRRFGAGVALMDFFDQPTVAGLAAALDRAQDGRQETTAEDGGRDG